MVKVKGQQNNSYKMCNVAKITNGKVPFTFGRKLCDILTYRVHIVRITRQFSSTKRLYHVKVRLKAIKFAFKLSSSLAFEALYLLNSR